MGRESELFVINNITFYSFCSYSRMCPQRFILNFEASRLCSRFPGWMAVEVRFIPSDTPLHGCSANLLE